MKESAKEKWIVTKIVSKTEANPCWVHRLRPCKCFDALKAYSDLNLCPYGQDYEKHKDNCEECLVYFKRDK